MPLHPAWSQLETDLSALTTHIRDFAATKPAITSSGHFTLREECLLEGFLSRSWQAWNVFCRTCVIESCIGTVDALGTAIAGLPDALSEDHVSGAAINAKQRPHPPYWGRTNTLRRVEPTWGDPDVLTNILTRLRPQNYRNCWLQSRPFTGKPRLCRPSEMAPPTTMHRLSPPSCRYAQRISPFRLLILHTPCSGSSHARAIF